MAIGTKADRPKNKKKNECINKVKTLVENFTNLILFNCDNVNSNQFKRIRKLAREHGEIVMGKNTLFKKGIQAKLDKFSKMERVLPQLSGNIGLFFTNKNLREMRDLLESISEQAPVKAHMIAQCDVVIPKGPTGLAPDKTNFFQALNISTMISKANIELVSDINLLKKGQKVGASEAALMQMLNLRPFSYKLNSKFIYDNGMCYTPDVLDINSKDIMKTFETCIDEIACLSLSIGYPTKVSVSHVIQSNLTDLLAICLAADISNTYVDEFKESSSRALEAAASSAAALASAPSQTESAKAPEPVQEEEEEEMMGFDIFDL